MLSVLLEQFGTLRAHRRLGTPGCPPLTRPDLVVILSNDAGELQEEIPPPGSVPAEANGEEKNQLPPSANLDGDAQSDPPQDDDGSADADQDQEEEEGEDEDEGEEGDDDEVTTEHHHCWHSWGGRVPGEGEHQK